MAPWEAHGRFFRAALLQVAQQAGDAFRSPAFWAALRGGR